MLRLATTIFLVLAFCGSSFGSLHFVGNVPITGADGAAFTSEATTLTDGAFSVKATVTATGLGGTTSRYTLSNYAGAESTGDTSNDFDNTGESVQYDLSFSDLNLPAGEQLVDGTFRAIFVTRGTSFQDSGTFDMNGNSYTWTEADDVPDNSTTMGGDFVPGSHFNSGGRQWFDLKVVDGANVLSFTKTHDGTSVLSSFALNEFQFEVKTEAIPVPEPSSFAFLGIATAAGFTAVKLRRRKK